FSSLLLCRRLRVGISRALLSQESSYLSAQILRSWRIIVPLDYYSVAAIPEDVQIRIDPRCSAAVTANALPIDHLVDKTIGVLGAHRRVYLAASHLLGKVGVDQLVCA